MKPHEMQIIQMNNLADLRRKQGETEEALSIFTQALKLISLHGVNPSIETAVCSNFGILLSSLGNHDKAIEFQQRALELDNAIGNPRGIGFSNHNLGMALVYSCRFISGIKYLKEALQIRRSIEDNRELLETLFGLSDAHFRLGHIEQAEEYAQRGRALQSKLGYIPALRGVTSMLAKVALRKGNVSEACKLQAEAVGFVEKERQKNRDLPNLDRFDSRYNINYLEAIELFLESKYYHAALTLIDRTRFRSGCDALEGVRLFGSPLQHEALPIPMIEKDELILVMWIYPDHSWVFPLTHESEKITPRKIVTSTREEPPIKRDLKIEWCEHFNVLLRQTQSAIDSFLDEIEAVRRIILIPHGISLQTPFAALKNSYTDEYLFRTHELQISPSLRYCMITSNKPKVEDKNYLVIGDPDEKLPYARKEAELVSKNLGCKPILGPDATRESFLEALSKTKFDIIHYAGHGSYTAGGLHSLILSDGPVTTNDILSIKPSANIVNIACCWGGMTDFSVWNELHGFIRALLISGVRNVVSSIYPLGDEPSFYFNAAFYDHYINKSQHPSKAFQKALSAIPDQHPVKSWGGLCLLGQR